MCSSLVSCQMETGTASSAMPFAFSQSPFSNGSMMDDVEKNESLQC